MSSNSILNPKSFHLFKINKENLLYDVNTNTVSKLNDFAYDLIDCSGKNTWKDCEKKMIKIYPDFTKKNASNIIATLKKNNFFKINSININRKKQNEIIHNLYFHRPYRIQLFLAQKCNLMCKYCYAEYNNSNKLKRLMSFSTAKKTVDFLVKRSGSRKNLQVTFFGGEPLLNYPILKKVVNYCLSIEKKNNKKFTFELITNGTLLTTDICNYLIKHDFLLFVSIDGWHGMHSFQRPAVNGKDYYSHIIKMAQYLCKEYKKNKSKKRVKIRANLTNTFHDIEKVYKNLEEKGFDFIGVAAIEPKIYENQTPGALTSFNLVNLDKKTMKLYINAIKKIKKGQDPGSYLKRKIRQLINQIKIKSIMGIRCGIGRNTAAVDTTGNIFPCHRYVGMNKYIMGNIDSGMDYKKTIGLYKKYNRATIKNCYQCSLLNLCGGPCPWQISTPTGKVVAPGALICSSIKKSIELGLWAKYKLENIKL